MLFDIYAVTKSQDPQEYYEYLVVGNVDEEHVERELKYFKTRIDNNRYFLQKESVS